MSQSRRSSVLGVASLLLCCGVACGGTTQSEAPAPGTDGGTRTDTGMTGHRDGASSGDAHSSHDGAVDTGPRGPGLDGTTTCNLLQLIDPILKVTDSKTGIAICDATATADAGPVFLSPCGVAQGCTDGCQYTVSGLSSSLAMTAVPITVSAPGYASATTSVTEQICGCDPSECAPADDVTVSLVATVTVDASPPGCPTEAPTSGTSCATEGLDCQYGSNLNPYCDALWACMGSKWQKLSVLASCPAATATCPVTYAAATGSVACENADVGELCQYAEGTCLCTQDPGGLPLAGGPQWSCVPITSGCPATLPKLGSSCPAGAPQDCDYGQCSGGPGLTCSQGYWTLANVACEG